MSRDALIHGSAIVFIDRSDTDNTIIPPDASLICEEDWKALLGDQSEEAYIAALGLVVDG